MITAWVKGFNTKVGETKVSGGSYNLFASRKLAELDTKTISFKIGNLMANETSLWEPFAVLGLNLTATK